MCVAEIMSVAPHPKADRLRVVQVLILLASDTR